MACQRLPAETMMSCFSTLSIPLYIINGIFFVDVLAGFRTCFYREVEDADEVRAARIAMLPFSTSLCSSSFAVTTLPFYLNHTQVLYLLLSLSSLSLSFSCYPSTHPTYLPVEQLIEEDALDEASLYDRLLYFWHRDVLHDRADTLRFDRVLSHRAGGRLVSRGDRIAFSYLCKNFPFDLLPCLPLHALNGGFISREWDFSVSYTLCLAFPIIKMYNLFEGRIRHRFDGISFGAVFWMVAIVLFVGHFLGCLFFLLGAHNYVLEMRDGEVLSGRFDGMASLRLIYSSNRYKSVHTHALGSFCLSHAFHGNKLPYILQKHRCC